MSPLPLVAWPYRLADEFPVPHRTGVGPLLDQAEEDLPHVPGLPPVEPEALRPAQAGEVGAAGLLAAEPLVEFHEGSWEIPDEHGRILPVGVT